MSVEFENDTPVTTTHPRSVPWIVKKGYVKDTATANRLLIAVMVIFFFLSAVVLYAALQSSETGKSQIKREVVGPTTPY